ncbi:MAG: hypothetical protein HRS57_00540 [Mycoplasmataceae bacterium]|nr:hypothetical protein [Mycoplasmataceae bacterium]
MKKGLLLCSGGMSTTMIASALNEQSDMEWDAMGVMTTSDWMDNISLYSVVLISPQIRFQFDKIKETTDEHGLKIMQIEPKDYIVTRVPQIIEKIKNL